MSISSEKYEKMTPIEKVVVLEKSVEEQGLYLKALQDSMKLLNRRNTLAVIELQMLVRDIELKYPDARELIDPVMKKVALVLDFKKPYEV